MPSSHRGEPVVNDPGRGDAVIVPETCGQSEHIAVEELRRHGLLAGQRTEEPSRSLPGGTVFGTIPRAGTLVARGERIAYVVSATPASESRGGRRVDGVASQVFESASPRPAEPEPAR